MLLPVARWFDWRARRYHRAGLPLLVELFVGMDGAAEFNPRVSAPPPTLPPPRSGDLARRLRRAFIADGFAGVASGTEGLLAHLEADPTYWCMLRHLLESMRRLGTCAEMQAGLARQAELPSPESIHRHLLHLHLLGIGSAVRLDRLALPVQRAGVPILCRDLPPIPPCP